MNKMRNLTSALIGLLALAALVAGLTWLVGPRGARPAAQRISLLHTPVPAATPTQYVAPTAPSEDWPTLTSPPTRVIPTRSGTPVEKPAEPVTPPPTRPPLLLTPIPEGTPPADLSGLYYVADTDKGPELRVIGMDAQGRRWGESQLAIDQFPANLVGLHLSPDGKYLALEFLGDGYGEVSIMERSSGRVWCPLEEPAGCWGGFLGWLPGNRFLFQPFGIPLEGVVPMGVVVVDLETGQFTPLDLPVEPKRGYSLAQYVFPSPDGSRLVYSIVRPNDGEEISELWTIRLNGEDKQLVRQIAGLVKIPLWSPSGEQLLYVYQGKSGELPTELWIVSTDEHNDSLLAANLPMPGEPRYRPAWSPDSRSIAFVQLDDPATFSNHLELWSNVYVVDVNTEQITRLSAFREHDIGYPTWSPDGKYVAFVSSIIMDEQTRYAEVWVASANGTQLYAVSEMAQWYNVLAWFPPVPTRAR